MNGGFKVYVALLCTSMIAGIPVGSMAAGVPSPPSGLAIGGSALPTPTVDPPPTPVEYSLGTDSLLPGKIPANFTPPAGWTRVRTQDFESGSLGTSEWFVPGTGYTTVRAHSGTSSARGRYAGDGSDVRWGIGGSQVGSFKEIYISVWEYIDAEARFNDEMFHMWLEKKWGTAGAYQHVVFNTDRVGGGSFNATDSDHVFQGEENPSSTPGRTFREPGPRRTITTGRWKQFEYWYRPNTFTAGTSGNQDGFMRWYEDGNLIYEKTNFNPNGGIDMNSSNVQIGGVYTKHVWRTGDAYTGSCGTQIGNNIGLDRQTSWNPCTKCPNQCPPNGTVPYFYRYFDDIIIMKR